MKNGDYEHIPVLPEETVGALLPEGRKIRRIIDGTLGCGGHSALLLEKNPELELLGIDRDEAALNRAAERLSFAGKRVHLKKGCFSEMRILAQSIQWETVDGILLDIGVSSPQIDDPSRGFSFRFDGPLDMRMDRTSPLSASRIVNQYSAEGLKKVFREYGELDGRDAANLAGEIIRRREEKAFSTTMELAEVCEKVLRGARRKGPPAPTLVFQALRIAVNKELDELNQALTESVNLLNPGGRLCVISFHSLEDRIVKNFFRDSAETCKCPPGLPVCICGWTPVLKVITRRPITAGDSELRENQRAACAKLRVAEKLDEKGETAE